jgi:hypothetical protein
VSHLIGFKGIHVTNFGKHEFTHLQPEIFHHCLNSSVSKKSRMGGRALCVGVGIVCVLVWNLPNEVLDSFIFEIQSLRLMLSYSSLHILHNSVIFVCAFGRACDTLIFCNIKEIWT